MCERSDPRNGLGRDDSRAVAISVLEPMMETSKEAQRRERHAPPSRMRVTAGARRREQQALS